MERAAKAEQGKSKVTGPSDPRARGGTNTLALQSSEDSSGHS